MFCCNIILLFKKHHSSRWTCSPAMSGSKIESGVQLFARLNRRPSLDKLNSLLFGECGPQPNEVIEISGNADKTVLTTDLLAKCLVPRQCGGLECEAVLINTNQHFNLLHLVQRMEKMMAGGPLADHIQSIKTCLSKLIVLNCYSYHHLAMTFLNLEKILSKKPNIALVLLDGLSSYYWEYRLSNGIISLQNYHSKILENLRNCTSNANVVVMYTRSEADVSLDVNWKIVLQKQDYHKFEAFVTNNKKGIQIALPCLINNGIIFYNCL